MIPRIDIFRRTLHFRSPFQIAYEKVEEAEVVIVKIETDDGLYGLGNAAPDTEVTGETIEGVLDVLKKNLTPGFFRYPFGSWYAYHTEIQNKFAGFPSAQAAVEEAMLSLWSQIYKIPLSDFFGGYQKSSPIMITIGIKEEKEMMEEIQKRLGEGFKVIKLKCGLDVENDIHRIKKARSIIPSDCRLVLDANQGYSLTDAKKLLNSFSKSEIELIEQPVDQKDLEGLKQLHRMGTIPVIADESVVSIGDATHLLTHDYVAGVNIKLMKCGGPINFIQIFNLAKRLNKIIVLGCMYETNISMTTGAQLALGLPLDYVDLDSGPLDFSDDPTTGGAVVENGIIRIEGPILIT